VGSLNTARRPRIPMCVPDSDGSAAGDNMIRRSGLKQLERLEAEILSRSSSKSTTDFNNYVEHRGRHPLIGSKRG
jgi:hypothetical protein